MIDFSSETVEAKKQYHSTFQILKEKAFKPESSIQWNIFQEWKGNEDTYISIYNVILGPTTKKAIQKDTLKNTRNKLKWNS